jgi:hypothetical protein
VAGFKVVSVAPAGDERIERFDVPTLAQLEPLRSKDVGDEELAEVQKTLGRWLADPDFTYENALQECDKILGTCGVVSLDIEDTRTYTDEGIRMCPPFSYCNAGDTYAVTLARDHAAGRWVVACWGALAEEYEQENELGDHSVYDECPEECPSCLRKTFSLEFFPGSARGPSYSWVCNSCNHHCFASSDETEHSIQIGEDDDFREVRVKAIQQSGNGHPWMFAILVVGAIEGRYWQPDGSFSVNVTPHEWDTAQEAREAWLTRDDKRPECLECGRHNDLTARRCENENCRFLLIAVCASCGKDVRENESHGEGDIGDEDIPSFCSEDCYTKGPTSKHWADPGVEDEDDEGGDLPGTGDEA